MTGFLDTVKGVLGVLVVVIFPYAIAGLMGSARAFSRAKDRGHG